MSKTNETKATPSTGDLKYSINYKRLVETAPDISYVYGTKSGAKFWSPQVKDILGISPSTLIKDPFAWVNAIHPEDQPKVQDLLQSLEHQKTFSIEYRVKDSKGNWHWLNDRTTSVNKVGDEFIIEGMAQDITHHKLIESQLQQSEEKFRKAFMTSPDSISISRLTDGMYISVNEGFSQILGYDEDEVIGKTAFELNIWADESDRDKLLKLLKESGKVESFEAVFVAKDGHTGVGLLSASVIELNGVPHMLAMTHDISDLRNMSLALEESEEKYRLIVENANDGIEITLNNKIIYANSRFAEMLGYTQDEIKDVLFSHIFSDEAKADLSKRQDMREKGKELPTTYQTTFIKKDGSIIDVEVNYQIINYKNSAATFAIVRDVTESRKMETELRKLSTAVEQSPSMIVITDLEGKIEYVNPIFCEITGYTCDEIKGKMTNILKSGFLADDVYKELWNTITGGKIWRGEFRNKRKSGDMYWENASISPITDNDGQITHFLKVAEDVSEWKTIEEALKYSEEQYRLIVEKANDGILISQNDQFIYRNSQFVGMLGYTEDEFEKITFKDIYTEEGIKDLFERHRKRQAGENLPPKYETTFKKKDGSIIYVEVNYQVIDFHGNEATFAIVRDITDKKEADKVLKAALARAEEADQLKSAFLANMSHEIRTPMNGIIGFANLLKSKKLTDEKRDQYLDIIEQSGKRLMNIINDLIDISKIEAKQIDVKKTFFNLTPVMTYLYQFFEVECNNKDISLIAQYPETDIFLHTDKDKLEAILINLLKNAVKFTNQGSITLGCDVGDNKVNFYIKDSGIGIPKEKQDHIFDRFAQVDNSISKPYEGAGLGLAISSAFVDMLGGTISLKSEPNEGSTFSFSIPYKVHNKAILTDKDLSIPDTPQESGQAVKNLKILVAEDDEYSFKFIEILLEKYAGTLLHANNGKEAIDLCKDNPDIDLILMDVKMPVLDGYQATKHIRRFNQDVKIIAQTAYALSDDKDKMLSLGCNDYITKPIQEEDLTNMIEKMFRT